MQTSPPDLGLQVVDQFVAYLARGFGCSHALVVSPDQPETLPDDRLERSIIVGRLDPGRRHTWGALLAALRACLERAPVAVVTCDVEDIAAGRPGDRGQDGPAPGPRELERLLVEGGLNVAFVGRAPRDEADRERRTVVAVLENTHRPPRGAAPADFRVVAIMPTYNEEDVIAHSLRYLVDQGIQVYLIDNWSTDTTLERARPFLGHGLVDVERFPAAGPSRTYDLRNLLTRVEEVSETLDADWLMLYDADERRRSPWLGLSLKDGLHYVDRCGFNCVDHVTVNFWPVDDRFDPARDVERQLTHFELSDHPGHFHQRRVWKNLGRRVSLAPTAGHDVGFEGRLVYPFKFLLKHYPIRSQAHGERKILAERKPRWNAEERSLGWHAQYDALETMGSFLRDPAELTQAADETFHQEYLVERLSGIGVFREPPFWATPPR